MCTATQLKLVALLRLQAGIAQAVARQVETTLECTRCAQS